MGINHLVSARDVKHPGSCCLGPSGADPWVTTELPEQNSTFIKLS